jgi:YHS domain-containing protein
MRDPICGVYLEDKRWEVQGRARKLFFCSQSCKDSFTESCDRLRRLTKETRERIRPTFLQ